MKVIIAGSRTITEYTHVILAIKRSGFEVTQVVCGGAAGVDNNGHRWAVERNIPIKLFMPDWLKYGKSAGPKRNAQMAEYGDALIAIWDGKSRGTKNMIDEATKRNLKVYIYTVDK